jgi:hypothetical protein
VTPTNAGTRMNFQACTRAVPSSSPSTLIPTTRTSLQRSSARRPYVPRQIRSRDSRPTGMSPSLQIYHPNVDLEGNVCLNILREDWKPVLNLNSVMVGLQYLFLEPNADDPLNKGKYHLSSIDGTRLTTVFIQRPRRSSARTAINSSRTSSPPWSAGTSRASSTTMSWHRPAATSDRSPPHSSSPVSRSARLLLCRIHLSLAFAGNTIGPFHRLALPNYRNPFDVYYAEHKGKRGSSNLGRRDVEPLGDYAPP